VSDLAERYGAPARSRRLLVVGVAALLVGAGIAWLAWVVLLPGRPEVTSQMVGFTVRGQHAATVTFTVARRGRDVPASCLLRAFADDHAVVGELTVPVGSGPAERRLKTTVRTERRATTVDLVGCTTPGQSAPG
jgi:Domain of unknown function (DUF4307)